MIMNWLRGNRYAAILLTLLRVYVGWEWMTAGWHKLTGDKAFDAAGFIQGAISKPVVDMGTHENIYPNFVWFLSHIALPHVGQFNVLVPWGEFLVGLGLIVGGLTTAAAFFGLLMNFMFMFAGTVSMNPWLVLLGVILLIAGANAGRVGADHYLLPVTRQAVNRLKHVQIKKKFKKIPM
ncbi:DoxX family protein [Paenibacillus glycinis]|uniref:DoxX family membrane protein n=1 Tax=Paenibacillus glycinis TaxID=2697035 RepID=A0ABW9XYT8_9BACL|nr:DoxX family protein [Paenibacillus glycinis]NBD27872.1 DoxX family membrane protein [Paenibacillus glycinis]